MNVITVSLKEQLTAGLLEAKGLLGAVAVSDDSGLSVLSEGNGLLLVLVVENGASDGSISHYMQDGIRIQERRISRSTLEAILAAREDRTFIQWMIQGEIWVDPQAYLAQVRAELLEYPAIAKEQKLLAEFSMFLKRYMQCKEFLHAEQILDAYSCILRAIHHWARIVVLEAGVHPEATVWQQVRQYNTGVYKLYEELTASPETLKQRVELVLLACEFSVMSKMESCCSMLIRILEESEEPMGVEDLLGHPYLQGQTGANLPLLLNKLARKALIKEVAVATDAELFSLEVKYTK
ncbi:nucleotidyltransferase-like protein [Gorillibacterium sp. sgz5001074]|uniref:nucleotidyltransferase-like protein n=1 Tax=Gorillibacterium sp. sgz5001074 TaxID=3446695 RepID=UPI003F6805DE